MEKAKQWQTPELIILLRGKPEEAVLITCKHSGGGGGSTADNTDCGNTVILGNCANDCDTQAAS